MNPLGQGQLAQFALQEPFPLREIHLVQHVTPPAQPAIKLQQLVYPVVLITNLQAQDPHVLFAQQVHFHQ